MREGRRCFTAALAAAVALGTAACGGSSGSTAAPSTAAPSTVAPSTVAPTTAAPTTATPTTVRATTTTVFAPSAAQADAAGAAATLVSDWGRQDRAGAASVASPAAVASLFAVSARQLQFRGCSDGAPPITCTYADRSSAAGGLYEVNTAQTAAGGWYVASVQIEQ